MRSSETICETEQYDVTMCSCCISLDGKFVAVGFENGDIKVWEYVALNWWLLELNLTGRGIFCYVCFYFKIWFLVVYRLGNSRR